MSIRFRARRRALAASVTMTVAVLTLASACGGAGQDSAKTGSTTAPSLGTVTMSIDIGDLYNVAEYVGLKFGFFEKYGITPKFVTANSSSVGLQLLATGHLDFLTNGLTTFMLGSQTTHTPLRAVVNIAGGGAYQLVCRDNAGVPAGYTKAAYQALVGKTVSVASDESPGYFALLDALKHFGVSSKKVNVTDVAGNSLQAAALIGGSSACVMMLAPAPRLLPAGQYEMIMNMLTPGQYPPNGDYTGSMFGTTKSFADAHPKIIVAMQKAITDALNFAGDPKNASKMATGVASYFSGFSHAQLTSIFKSVTVLYAGKAAITEFAFKGSVQQYNEFAPLFDGPKISGQSATFGANVLPQIPYESNSEG
jgi:ABC-type nitrate/sulfonate/bicarbonate transport system substrate-binding protein